MDHLEIVNLVIDEYDSRHKPPDLMRAHRFLYPLENWFRFTSNHAGVYIFFDQERSRILYVGTADQLGRRLNVEYFGGFAPDQTDGDPIWGGFSKWPEKPRWMYVVSYEGSRAYEAPSLEAYLIIELDPLVNRVGRLGEKEKARMRPSYGNDSTCEWAEMYDGRLIKRGIRSGHEKHKDLTAPTVEEWWKSGVRWSRRS